MAKKSKKRIDELEKAVYAKDAASPVTSEGANTSYTGGPSQDSGKGSFLFNGEYDDRRQELGVYMAAYEGSPWIKRGIDLIASAVSKTYQIVPVDDSQPLPEDDAIRPLLDFLNEPNPYDTWHTLMQKFMVGLLAQGCIFAEIVSKQVDSEVLKSVYRNKLSNYASIVPNFEQELEDMVTASTSELGVPTMLRMLPAEQMEVAQDPQGNIIGYFQWTYDGKKIAFRPDQIFHMVAPGSRDTTYGQSAIKSVVNLATIDALIDNRQKKMLQDDIAIDMLFSVPDTNVENVKKLTEQLAAQYRQSNANGHFLVTTHDVKVEDLSKSKEGDFLQLKLNIRDEIAMVLGIPLSVLGDNKGNSMNGAGSDNHLRNFVEHTVRPKAVHFQNALNRHIINRFGNIVAMPVMLRIVLEDADDKAPLETMWNQGINNGSLTRNEVRAFRGQQPLPEGGDLATVTAGMTIVPVDKIGTVEAAPEQAPPHPNEIQAAIKKAREAIRVIHKAL